VISSVLLPIAVLGTHIGAVAALPDARLITAEKGTCPIRVTVQLHAVGPSWTVLRQVRREAGSWPTFR